MSRKIVEQTGLVTILWYAHSPALSAGLPYLGTAACVGSYCIPSSFILKARLRKGEPPQTLWPLARRVRVLLLVSWQLAILGWLNIWAAGEPAASRQVLLLSGLLLVLNIAISDRLLSLADSPDQDGGAKPLKFFDRRRSRRLFFWGFIVYPASVPIYLGADFSVRGEPYASPLHPPQLCLALAAVMSAGTAALVFQRYRGLASDKRIRAMCALGVLLIVWFAAAFTFLEDYSRYVYVLSSLTVMCLALSTNWVLRAKGVVPGEGVEPSCSVKSAGF